ncbi:hypothetical protein [Ensifer sp. B1-9]|uniref:hypothetical protein n=1 Tax=Ensifer sp. B1-9 TaxID=3141455 RepID=UPI003D20152D
MFFERPQPIEAVNYYDVNADGNIVIVPVPDFDEPTVHFEPLYEHVVSPAFIWGMAQAEARRRSEPKPHLHNILFNIGLRPREPVLPLAGTVFDPRRYRRP